MFVGVRERDFQETELFKTMYRFTYKQFTAVCVTTLSVGAFPQHGIYTTPLHLTLLAF